MALVVGDRVLGDRHIWRLLPLIPLRDLVALCVLFASFASDRISWRGDYFHLKDGKLARIAE
jgi:ceramide glucosyltransferase